MKLQHIFSLVNEKHNLSIRAVKRIADASDANNFLRKIELNDKESRKFVIIDCDANTAKTIIVGHVRDIYMGRRNFHFLLTSLVSVHFSICYKSYQFMFRLKFDKLFYKVKDALKQY